MYVCAGSNVGLPAGRLLRCNEIDSTAESISEIVFSKRDIADKCSEECVGCFEPPCEECIGCFEPPCAASTMTIPRPERYERDR